MTRDPITITVYDGFVTIRTDRVTFHIGTGDPIKLTAIGHGEKTLSPQDLVTILRGVVNDENP